MADSLVEYVLEKVNYQEYYKKQFPQWNGDFNSNVNCPFTSEHPTGEDKTASFSVNINKTGGCKCHGCGTKIGSIIHFEKATSGGTDEEAANRIFSIFRRPTLSSNGNTEKTIQPFVSALSHAPKIHQSILDDLKISKQTVERFLLGWNARTRRVTIPILDTFGQLLNIRHYTLPSMRDGEKYPKIINTDGYGSPAEMFPKAKVFSLCRGMHKPSVVYWLTGERDTLLAWDRGVPSFCYTTGENVCRKEWIEEIKELGCTIGVVRDNDKAGLEGAKKRLEALEAGGVNCFLVELPTKKKDFSDWVIEGGQIKDFLKLGRSRIETLEEETDDEDEEPKFNQITRISNPLLHRNQGEFQVADIGRTPKLFNHPILCRAIVSGKLDRTYSIPRTIRVADQDYEIPISREMLQLVRENDTAILKLIGFWLNTKAKIKILTHITVIECEIIPMIQPGIESVYTNQRCYYFGDMIECNKPYKMTIIPTTDMRTQETLGMIVDIEPVSNVLDNYSFSDKSCELLESEFNIGESDSFEMLKTLADLVAVNCSHIYNRTDLHIVALLTWMSPLQFEFPCEGIKRGWLNTLVVGDTENGKSEVCQAITKLLLCGVFISAESCSYVGLVGGAVKSANGGLNILRWGKIPLYNRQLVVIEELSGLTTFDISHMSEIRSAGIARYDKAGLTGETQAKTRLICLSNVRGESKSLADYNTGVQAAQGLVGQNEDLARFDLILTVTDDEVSETVINADRSTETRKTFTPDEINAFKELVMFAWSLKVDQIDFTVGAYRECLTQTLAMVKQYHFSLPVFKAGSGRLKLARIALSIACMQFSWNKERKKLVVTDKHVQCAAKLLHHLFAKPSFGYARYSKIQFNLQRVLNQDEVIKQVQNAFKEKEVDFYGYVSHCLTFTKFDVSEALGVHHMFVERVISQMFLSNLIKKGSKGSEWQLSTAGRRWIDKQLNTHAAV